MCILLFIKSDEQVNYMSYIKIFLLTFCIVFFILFIKDKLIMKMMKLQKIILKLN